MAGYTFWRRTSAGMTTEEFLAIGATNGYGMTMCWYFMLDSLEQKAIKTKLQKLFCGQQRSVSLELLPISKTKAGVA